MSGELLSSGGKWGIGAAQWDARAFAAMAVGVFWVVLGAVWAVPGVFGGDELLYQAMADAFARNGSLFVENGYDF